MSWSPDGKYLAVSGHNNLRIISRLIESDSETDWNLSFVPLINHESPISQIEWLSSNTLLTIDTEGICKIWNFSTRKLAYTFDITIKTAKYNEKTHTLLVSDSADNLHKCTIDCATDELLQPAIAEEVAEESLGKSFSISTQYFIILDHKNSVEKQSKCVTFEGDIEMKDENEAPADIKEVQNFYGNQEFEEKEISIADQLIGVKPQRPFMPAATTDDDISYKFLCWNSVGSVAVRDDMGIRCIEIDFADKSFHKNLVVEDLIDTKLACLSHNGALLASKAAEQNNDEYEDESNPLKYISQLKFVPFTNWNSIQGWNYKLPEGESTE